MSARLREDACSGSGELPSSDDLCYTGSFLVEKFFVKMSKQTATSGTVDLQDPWQTGDISVPHEVPRIPPLKQAPLVWETSCFIAGH